MWASEYKEKLKQKIHLYVRFVYQETKSFPKDELYRATSQLRRSALSISLNYIEGFARRKPAVQLNFLEIAYGSLKESDYILLLAGEEKWLSSEACQQVRKMVDEIGAMLWTEITALDKNLKKIKHAS